MHFELSRPSFLSLVHRVGRHEGGDVGDGAAEDERVDVVGAFVGINRLGVGSRGSQKNE